MEEGNTEQFELSLIGDIERDSGKFVVGERLIHQQCRQLLDILDEYKDRFAKKLGRTDIIIHKIKLMEGVPYVRRMYLVPGSLQDKVD